MTELKNIYTAIHNVYQKIGYVKKDGKIEFGRTKYTYVGEAAFIAALRPAMVQEGLFIKQGAHEVIKQETITETIRDNTKTTYKITIKASYDICHISGESFSIDSLGEGMDSGDKAIYKALTGAYKYALRQLFMIETGDDPDKTPSGLQESISQILHTIAGYNSISALTMFDKNYSNKLDNIKKYSHEDYKNIQIAYAQKQSELEEIIVDKQIKYISGAGHNLLDYLDTDTFVKISDYLEKNNKAQYGRLKTCLDEIFIGGEKPKTLSEGAGEIRTKELNKQPDPRSLAGLPHRISPEEVNRHPDPEFWKK